MAQASQVRTYDPAASVVFLKTNERFGGLSNMAPGFPLRVNGIRIRTSEALYQACRFPHLPDVQRRIIDDHSPMTAKMRSKTFRKDSRLDWDAVRVKIMRWCLGVKLAQNWREFGRLLLATGDRPIVEQSRKDDFWGAKVSEDGTLVGMNVLGRLLMELREQLKADTAESLKIVEPLAIPDFLLLQRPIETIYAEEGASRPLEIGGRQTAPSPITAPPNLPQPSLFDRRVPASTDMDATSQSTSEVIRQENIWRYPAYKIAHVHWLGEIPAHWQEKRGKYFFHEIDERSGTGEEELLSVSHTTGVTPRSQKNVTMFKAESYVGHKIARPNDIVVNTMWAWMSALGVSKDVGIVSPAYGVYRPHNEADFLPAYLDYLLRTPMLRWEYICRSTGIRSSRLRLYPNQFLDIAFPRPPREEQERMVAFLRAKDLQVRRLIRNKRGLIALLNEQKQAIINRAVTRGLNPDAPMKPTGIDWMPEVPAHWEMKPLKHWLRERAKMLSDKTDPEYEFDYLDISCVGTGFLAEQPERIRFENAPSRARQVVKKGDTLISTVRTYLKAVYFVEDEWPDLIASTGFAVLRPVEAVQPKLLGYVLQSSSFIERVIKSSIGVAYPAISESRLGTLHVALPPSLQEQNGILDFIGSETAALDSAIKKAQREISLIREYRERLIADVVTGKLDVRHVEIMAPAPEPEIDEGEEFEADDETAADELMEEADADD